MTNNHVRRLSGILLAAAIFSVHPCPISSQELESRSSSTLRWKVDYSSAPDRAERHTTLTEDAVLATLPDAPMPQNQAQDQAQDPPAPAASETHLNRYPIFHQDSPEPLFQFKTNFRYIRTKPTAHQPSSWLPLERDWECSIRRANILRNGRTALTHSAGITDTGWQTIRPDSPANF